MNFKTLLKSSFLAFLLSSAIVPTATAAETAPLTLKVYTSPGNFNVTSTLIMGRQDAILIDAQFTLADAYRLVAEILESGRNLKTIFISHGDPDYYFGLAVLKAAFPNAQILATPSTVAHINATYQKKLTVWSPRLGANGPSTVIVPEVTSATKLQLEDLNLEILTLDATTPQHSFVWIPSIQAIVGGVAVFNGHHVWTADTQTKEQRLAWQQRLDGILALNAKTIVPGHLQPGSAMDNRAVTYTRDYLQAYERELAKARNSGELVAAMQKAYPNAGLGIALEIGAKVNKGEMKW